jgi:uncharacterized membrane protein
VRWWGLPLAAIVLAFAAGLAAGLGPSGSTATGGAGMLLLCAFLLFGGHRAYGWAGVGMFVLTMYATAFALEALSIATGFPFGGFQHNGDALKILGVPPAVPLVYAIAGWTAWVLARQIIAGSAPLRGARRALVPLGAALILAGYDAVIDPVGGTIEGGWSYAHPGGLSGVPLTNFGGWILTGFVGFTVFSLFEERVRTEHAAGIFGGTGEPVVRGGRLLLLVPAALWLGMALPSLFPFVHQFEGSVTAGASRLAIADIHESAAIVSLFSMVMPVVLAVGAVLGGPRGGAEDSTRGRRENGR